MGHLHFDTNIKQKTMFQFFSSLNIIFCYNFIFTATNENDIRILSQFTSIFSRETLYRQQGINSFIKDLQSASATHQYSRQRRSSYSNIRCIGIDATSKTGLHTRLHKYPTERKSLGTTTMECYRKVLQTGRLTY